MGYSTKQESAELISVWASTVMASNRLMEVLDALVDGVCKRMKLTDVDDAKQDFMVIVVRNLHKLDAKQNVFSYLTSTMFRVLYQRHRNSKAKIRAVTNHYLFDG